MSERSLPTLYPERCTACGLCLGVCPGDVLLLQNGAPVMAEPLECTYCGACEEVCPEQAVELYYEIVRMPLGTSQEHLVTRGDAQ